MPAVDISPRTPILPPVTRPADGPTADEEYAANLNRPLDILGQSGLTKQVHGVEEQQAMANAVSAQHAHQLVLQRAYAGAEAERQMPARMPASARGLIAHQLHGREPAIPMAETPAAGLGSGLLGMLGIGAGLANMWKGSEELGRGEGVKGTGDIVNGATGLVQGGTGALMPFLQAGGTAAKVVGDVGAGAGLVSGLTQSLVSVLDMDEHGVTGDNAVGLGTGGMNTLGGAAALAGNAPLAMIGSAGALGLTIGSAINDLTENSSKDNFKDEHCRQRTAQTAAIDFGLSEEEKYRQAGFSGTTANVLGSMASVGRGAANVVSNAALNAWHALGHWAQ
ncbi:MAG: hypothetical protein K8W52_12955 [Deltaproteobacteria bacterium]|nr:hypothetical protein [Deltaproteobacteria bacterium]